MTEKPNRRYPVLRTVAIDPATSAWLKERAAALDLSVSWLVRRAVEEYRERCEQKKGAPEGA